MFVKISITILCVVIFFFQELQCSNDPDICDSFESIVKRYGYQMENITVQTDDGYILQNFRISRVGTNMQNITGPPLVIWHAFDRNARCFVVNEKDSLGILTTTSALHFSCSYFVAFYYADAGYDVWLPNVRGTVFSSHISLTPNDAEYWDFSYGKIGKNDVKAVVEMIVEKTGQKLITMGHSLGTSALFVYASAYPEDASKNLKGIIAHAPAINLYHTKTIYLSILSNIPDLVRTNFGLFKINYIDSSLETACQYKLVEPFCELLINSLFGKSDNINLKYSLPKFTGRGNEPISSQVFINYLQMIQQKGYFADYSYGPLKNLQVYGKINPPAFNLKNINIRVDIFCGINDYVCSCEDAKTTFNMLETEKSYTILPNNSGCHGKVAHLDLFMCSNMKHCVFDPIDNILANYINL
ncbi:unnamed protein product [Brassicogethes aeneus]|uniref:Lipase n=1 Tax=Brassicogethes aeneus TaxID=1431903 RepID=A0A9P0B6X4_BRAAE|nr:unnamed protein product [Brassicogethes aeneus]